MLDKKKLKRDKNKNWKQMQRYRERGTRMLSPFNRKKENTNYLYFFFSIFIRVAQSSRFLFMHCRTHLGRKRALLFNYCCRKKRMP
jgi:hypothetical protein